MGGGISCSIDAFIRRNGRMYLFLRKRGVGFFGVLLRNATEISCRGGS